MTKSDFLPNPKLQDRFWKVDGRVYLTSVILDSEDGTDVLFVRSVAP